MIWRTAKLLVRREGWVLGFKNCVLERRFFSFFPNPKISLFSENKKIGLLKVSWKISSLLCLAKFTSSIY